MGAISQSILPRFVGPNQSLSGQGFQRLPGGLIIQWGSLSFADFAGNLSVGLVFPVTFPTSVFGVYPVSGLTSGFAISVMVDEASITPSGFTAVLGEWAATSQVGGVVRWFSFGS